jgi:ATP:ADP antiporter, AAA family
MPGRTSDRITSIVYAAGVMKNPLRAVLDIRRQELPLALLMFLYFFLVITTFWILKPIKKAVFIQYYDQRMFEIFGTALKASQAELVAKVLNMGVAFVAVIVFTWLTRRFARQQLTHIFSVFFGAGFIGYALLLANAGPGTVWTFYLYGDLYSTVMVATFFAFLNDAVTPAAARRLYGLIVLGGVAGGVFGTTFVRLWIDTMNNEHWMWVCLGLGVVISLAAAGAGRLVNAFEAANEPERKQEPEKKVGGNPAIEGARLVFRSRYLLSIVTMVALYEIVSTVLDFQFTETISHYLDGDAIGRQFSTVYTITNITSLVVQVFLTGVIMSRFRLTVSLLVLPIAVLAGSGAFLALPILWVGSSLNTVDNALSYSINQSAREALYTPTSRDEKYKAKAFIDMFVQRFAKAIAVVLSLGVTMLFTDFGSLRWLSLFTIVVGVMWLLAARYAGQQFHRLTDSDEP